MRPAAPILLIHPAGNFAGQVGGAAAYLVGLYNDQPEAAATDGDSVWDVVPGELGWVHDEMKSCSCTHNQPSLPSPAQLLICQPLVHPTD
jgi:hypothetical protein